MALISIILGLILDRSWAQLQQYRQFTWFDTLTDKIIALSQTYINNNTGQLLLVLAPPVLLMFILQGLFAQGDWLGFFWFVFSVAIFTYCLGPLNLDTLIDQFVDSLEKNDTSLTKQLVGDITNVPASDDEDQMLDDVAESLLVTINHRLFAVIFWFAVLGPLGALLYKLNNHIHENRPADPVLGDTSSRLQGILDWLPVRLMAAGFALTGHFEAAVQAYHERSSSEDLRLSNRHLLIDVAKAAVHGTDVTDGSLYIRSVRGLVLRSLVVWLAAIAIITLIGWG